MPIPGSSVESLLLQAGFLFTHETDYKKEFYLSGVEQYMYLNKTSGDSNSTLVLHPDLKNKRESFLLISGVKSSDPLYHSSNMRKFPKRLNNGKTPIHYGIPFGFEDTTACREFLRKLKGIEPNDDADELDDLEGAEASLYGLTDTEKKAVIKSRIGQGLYRELLVQMWGGCSVTGLTFLPALKASHIKPWRVSSNLERLDTFNGLLLIPDLDTSFDRGFISFSDGGDIIVSSEIPYEAQDALGVNSNLKLKVVMQGHREYLEYHRANVFRQ